MTSEQKIIRLKLINCVGEVTFPTDEDEQMEFVWENLVGDFELNKTFKVPLVNYESKDVICDIAHILRSLYLKTDILETISNCKLIEQNICGENDIISAAKTQIKDNLEYSLRDFTLEEQCHFANVYNFVTGRHDMLFSVTEYSWINEINELYPVVDNDNLGIFKIDNPDMIDYYVARHRLFEQKRIRFLDDGTDTGVNVKEFENALMEYTKMYNLVKTNTSNEFTTFNIKP